MDSEIMRVFHTIAGDSRLRERSIRDVKDIARLIVGDGGLCPTRDEIWRGLDDFLEGR